MNGDVTVRDVMTREYVGVSEGDTVAGVADLMVEAGVEGAVVLRGAEPVGLVDARDVLAVVAAGGDPDSVTARAAMSDGATLIDAGSALEEAVSTLVGQDARRLVVVDELEVVGTLSEHDVITARSTFPESEEQERPLAVGGEGPTDDRFSTQSVCEACGSLAGSLASVNGQLLCADCREM